MVERLNRLRRTPRLRALVRETRVGPDDLVLPIFVTEVDDDVVEIPSMPGVHRWPVERVAEVAARADGLGIGAVLLFGIPAEKDARGSQADADTGVVQRGVRALRGAGYEGVIITDVCLCEYTEHGHCGILDDDGALLVGPTDERLAATAVSHARAGADIVAPSAMVDGMVFAIRDALDGEGFDHVPVLAYSAKFASAYYGPFRDAAGGAPRFGDRRSHQMDPANAREAMREHEQDVAEGADILMVKPGLAYLDVVRRTRDTFPEMPLAVYNVSGEYSMVKAAAERGWVDERAVVMETLTAFRRAGADLVITYHALDAALWMTES
ncbi:MAG: porphobilinogen synthase [Gemmatimonadota bacterium]|nr:porphobilinogen synthase [Gemmatimonadota bacterium]